MKFLAATWSCLAPVTVTGLIRQHLRKTDSCYIQPDPALAQRRRRLHTENCSAKGSMLNCTQQNEGLCVAWHNSKGHKGTKGIWHTPQTKDFKLTTQLHSFSALQNSRMLQHTATHAKKICQLYATSKYDLFMLVNPTGNFCLEQTVDCKAISANSLQNLANISLVDNKLIMKVF